MKYLPVYKNTWRNKKHNVIEDWTILLQKRQRLALSRMTSKTKSVKEIRCEVWLFVCLCVCECERVCWFDCVWCECVGRCVWVFICVWFVSGCVCVCGCLYVCEVWVGVSVCLSVFMFMCVFVYVCECLYDCVSVYVGEWEWDCQSVCVMCVCVSLCAFAAM